MKRKRIISIVLALMLAFALLPAAMAADLPFTDVPDDAWYAADVESAYQSGIINGKSADKFAPDDNMTYAEAVKLASCMLQLMSEGEITLENGDPWYQSYVDYAAAAGIISHEYDWNAPATRAGYLEIFAHILPTAEINYVPEGSIPDVPITHPQAYEIYYMYRLGIIQGVDANFSCAPDSNIKRSEVSAIITRIMDPEKRKTFSIPYPEESGAPNFDSAAANALNEYLATATLPDGEKVDYQYNDVYDYYAVYDVDGDGKYELMFTIYNTAADKMLEVVYKFNESNGTFEREIASNPDLTYFQNGIIYAPWAQQTGVELYGSTSFDIYQYNKDADDYEYVMGVTNWSKATALRSADLKTAFPDADDKDGDGIVYMFYFDGVWDGKYIDESASEEYLSQFFPNEGDFDSLVNPQWHAMYQSRG
ncbi:MAG: S-layer homology domain-containing protein [Clostridia bacterium]|nr:S-layer homology domain-containing protein [Clostridia bacterium]